MRIKPRCGRDKKAGRASVLSRLAGAGLIAARLAIMSGITARYIYTHLLRLLSGSAKADLRNARG